MMLLPLQMPALAALAYHRASGREAAAPNQSLDYAENFLFMLDAGRKADYKPHPRLARAMVRYFHSLIAPEI